VRRKLRLRQTVATAQILYLQPSLQLVVAKAAAQLPALLVRLAARAAVQGMAALVELLEQALQTKVMPEAHQRAQREITVVPVVVAQVLRLQA
jgi:hypothetical protein